MSGQILWVSWSQLVLPALVSALILAVITLKPKLLDGAGFYFIFAIVITLSVELVGVYLVFSTLILPALALNKYLGKAKLALAYLVGIVGYISGLWLSASYDLPSGAAIVATLAVSGLLFRVVIAKSNQSVASS
jgi:zinc/manganese transport system permease protein